MYPDELLKKVKSFGALQYDVERMITILQPESPAQFRIDFADHDSVLFAMWNAGFLAGQYNLDAQQFELAKSEADKLKVETDLARIKLQNLQQYQQLKTELFPTHDRPT